MKARNQSAAPRWAGTVTDCKGAVECTEETSTPKYQCNYYNEARHADARCFRNSENSNNRIREPKLSESCVEQTEVW